MHRPLPGADRRATHARPSDAFGGYLRPPWSAICAEFAKLRVELRTTADVIRLPLAALALGAALAALPAVAVAHAELVSSDPEAGANLDAAPSEVTLTFDDELEPDGSGFTVTDHHDDEVGSGTLDLDVADRNILAGGVSISEV